jgi:hypothetical protein
MSERPYATGYNGHARVCDCEQCAAARVYTVEKLWRANGRYAEPKSPDATIFVRSHFRRGTKHLAKFPNTKRFMRDLLKNVAKDNKSDG